MKNCTIHRRQLTVIKESILKGLDISKSETKQYSFSSQQYK